MFLDDINSSFLHNTVYLIIAYIFIYLLQFGVLETSKALVLRSILIYYSEIFFLAVHILLFFYVVANVRFRIYVSICVLCNETLV